MKREFHTKLCLFLGLMVAGFCTKGQQQILFTQYMFNQLAINPAYAGTGEALSLTAMARQQWFGVEGAPSNQMFSIDGPLTNKNIGLGLMFERESVGVTQTYNLYGVYAYKVHFRRGSLSFGLQAGVTSFEQKLSELQLPAGTNDPIFAEDVKDVVPNFGAGLYYHSDRFYIGFSVPHLLESSLDGDNDFSRAQVKRHYFVTTGYLFELNHNLKLKPHVLLRTVTGAPLNVDLNLNLLIKEVVWLGVSYRSFNSVNALVEVQVTPKFRFGFSHDFMTNDFAGITAGSNEIVLNYRFLKHNPEKVISPRYF